MTAGKGSEGAGDADRRIEGEEPNEDLLLWLIAFGGFIGRAKEVGVPGQEGAGDPIVLLDESTDNWERKPISGGAGLFDEILRPGRSIFKLWPTFLGSSRLSSVY